MDSERISFNIVKKLEDLKAKEKEEMTVYKDINRPRTNLGRKVLNMIYLKANEESFEDVSFDKEEREAIVKSEELRRSYFCKQSFVLPLSIISTVGYMAVTKRCMRIDTFLANFNLLSGVFAGSYFIANALLNLAYMRKIDNYKTVLEKVYEKARLHSECVSLVSDLKFDDDSYLE